jgi:redox-sensitive bicupin YhaK (pirin superfamily)
VTQGSIEVAGDTFEAGRMMVFRPGDRISVKAGPEGARLMALGGATMNEGRYIWWNFVSSSKDRIEEAKDAWKAADWANGPFRLPPGDNEEFIPITDQLEGRLPLRK